MNHTFFCHLSKNSVIAKEEMIAVQVDIRDNAFLSPTCFESGGGAFDCCVACLAPSLSTVSCWREKSVNDVFGQSFPGPHVRKYIQLRGFNIHNACLICGVTVTLEGEKSDSQNEILQNFVSFKRCCKQRWLLRLRSMTLHQKSYWV